MGVESLQRWVRIGLVSGVVLGLSGCDSTVPIRVDIPLSRFDTPTVPTNRVGVQVGFLQANSVELTPDLSAQDPDPQNPTLSATNSSSSEDENGSSNTFAVSGSVSLAPRHRVSVFRNDIFGDAPNGLKYQFQFLGPTWPNVGQGSVTASVTAAAGYNEVEEDDDGRQVNYHQVMQDVGLIFGTYLINQVAIYGGPFYTEHKYYGDYTRETQNAAQASGQTSGQKTDQKTGFPNIAIIPGGGGGGVDDGGDPPPATVTTDLRGDIRIRGGTIGLAIYPAKQLDMAILVELVRSNVESGSLDEYETTSGVSFRYAFGR